MEEKRVETKENILAVPEGSVQAQQIEFRGTCPECGHYCQFTQRHNLIPKYCYKCGSKMTYALTSVSL